MQKFRNSNQMKAFMKKESRRLNISIQNTYSTFVARCFLEKLSKYNSEQILVKGSSTEVSCLGTLIRPITDVDIASINKFNINNDIFGEIMDDSSDGFCFSLKRDPRTTNTGIYKLSFELAFDTIKQPLSVDFQEEYSRLIEPKYRVMPKIFEGDKEFEIYTPSFEEYLAEKLRIIVESNKPDVANTRVKDFYDIYQLHGGMYDSEKLTEYFGKMLSLRGKINIQDADTRYLDKDFIDRHTDIWNSASKKYSFMDKGIDLEGAVYYTRAVLREQLHKNGNLIVSENAPQYTKK